MTANFLLLLTAAIWGFGFVAQVIGMDYLEPFGFIAARFLLGSLSLLPVIWFFRKHILTQASHLKPLLWGSLVSGTILFAASSFQQVGLLYTTASNASFITGMYMIFVPLIGLLLGVRTSCSVWLGCLIACFGLFVLGLDEHWQVGYGDLLQLAGAALWAVHILAIDHFGKRVSGLLLALGQFLVCAALAGFVSSVVVDEGTTVEQLIQAGPTLFYAGIVTVGVAYTVQVIAQAKAHPAHAGIILSLEAVFGAIGGYWLLDELLNPRQLVGCGLMLIGMIVSQAFLPKSKTGNG
jgi:drug/metabolite transporter (DMT)-like permease